MNRKHFTIAALALLCLSLVAMPSGTGAQTSDLGLSVKTGSPTATRGEGVAVFGLVTNNTSSKMRTTVSFSAHSPCGTETFIGQARVWLDPGKSVALSSYYAIPADACTGTYAITLSEDSGKGKNSTSSASTPSATAYVDVQ